MMEQGSLGIGSIGQKLEAARLSKGVSISEAGQATKILSKYIDAMEHDDFGVLSAPVYARSFLKMYAKYLGMEHQPLLDEYIEKHAPSNKRGLSEEVCQTLTTVDHVKLDTTSTPMSTGEVLGDVTNEIPRLANSTFSFKTIAIVGGGILLLVIILFSLKQCTSEPENAPAPTVQESSEREPILESTPALYLMKPGKVETPLK